MDKYICIETVDIASNKEKLPVLIKKGDVVTLHQEHPLDDIATKLGYEFKEHLGVAYASNLFLKLPPEKIQYVTLSKETVETILEPCLN